MSIAVHKIKCLHEYFKKMWTYKKLFEVRKDDREYRVNDILEIWETDSRFKVKRVIIATVDYILRDFEGLKKEYVVMGLTINERTYKQHF